jgi:hypothetical protein
VQTSERRLGVFKDRAKPSSVQLRSGRFRSPGHSGSGSSRRIRNKEEATACLTPAWKPYDAAVSPERSKTELRADREEALVSGKDQDCPWLWLLAPGRGLFPSGSEHLTTRADARPRCFVARRRRRLITPVRSQRRHPGSTLVNLSPLPFATTSSN